MPPQVPAAIRARWVSFDVQSDCSRQDGPCLLSSNFVVARTSARGEGKADWKDGPFGQIPGDAVDFVAQPER
ncbi:MAG: hypothetical protein ABSC94_22540 [Polyangiaceae bacterium]|jgi:hypothetical protein